MNPILQQYIQDKTVPIEKRRNLATDLDSGSISETDAVGIITTKYKGKYSSPQQGPNWAQKLGQGVVNAGQKIANIAQEAAKPVDVAKQYSGGTEEVAFRQAGISEAEIDQFNKSAKPAEELLGGIYDYTVKPALKAGAMGIVGGAQSLEKLGGLITGGVEGFQKAGQRSQERSVDIPGLGEVNPEKNAMNTAGAAIDLGSQFIPGAKAGAGALKAGLKAGTQAAVQGFGKGLQEENADVLSAAGRGITEGLIGGGVTTIASAALKGLTKSAAQKAQQKVSQLQSDFVEGGLKQGLKENYVNALTDLPEPHKQLTLEYVDIGLNKLKDPINAPNVFDVAGKEIDNWVSNTQQFQKSLGQKLGAAKEAMADTAIDVSPLKNAMDKMFSKLNIKKLTDNEIMENIAMNAVDKAKRPTKELDFSKSSIKNAKEATTQLLDMWRQFSEAPTIKARDLEALTAQIEQVTNQFKTAGIGNTPAAKSLINLKKEVNKVLSNASPEFAQLNQQYAQLAKELEKVKNASKVVLGNGEVSYNGAQILRRSLGNAAERPAQAIKAMKKIEETFGLKAPQDLKTKAFLADLAETITNTKQPQSLAGGVEKAGEMVVDSVSKRVPGLTTIVEIAKAFKKPTPIIENQAKALKELIQKSITNKNAIPANEFKKIMPKLNPEQVTLVSNAVNTLVRSGLHTLFRK